MIEGIITKGIGGFYYIPTEQGVAECRARGKLRKQKIIPMVGDRVKITIVNQHPLEGAVEEICPRKNFLIRPPVANIDAVVIVMAAASPAPDFFLIDKLIACAEQMRINVVLVINKTDLCGGNEIAAIYRPTGYPVIEVSALTGEGVEQVRQAIAGRIVALAGNSGVGKSSILNYFGLELKTGEVSKIERGRHTTRHVELFGGEEGGYVMDTPGFSLLEPDGITPEELQHMFAEFAPYHDQCRFAGCCHVDAKAKDCAVVKAVGQGEIAPSRYESYTKLYHALKEIKKWDNC